MQREFRSSLPRRLRIESLEERHLMTTVGEVTQVAERVSVVGTDGPDRIIVYEANASAFFVRLNNQRHGPYEAADIVIHGEAGDDRISINHCVKNYVHGDAGNDTLYGSACGDHLYGDEGDDVILAGNGDDYAHGGKGNDKILGGSGDDTLLGGPDDDRLNGNNGNDTLFGDYFVHQWGQSGNGHDVLAGGRGDDLLAGAGGNDLLLGQSGADVLWGERDTDRLIGGGGDDLLIGGTEADVLRGGKGDDLLVGGRVRAIGGGCIHSYFTYRGVYNRWTTWRALTASLIADDSIDILRGGGGTDTFYSQWDDSLFDLRSNESNTSFERGLSFTGPICSGGEE